MKYSDDSVVGISLGIISAMLFWKLRLLYFLIMEKKFEIGFRLLAKFSNILASFAYLALFPKLQNDIKEPFFEMLHSFFYKL